MSGIINQIIGKSQTQYTSSSLLWQHKASRGNEGGSMASKRCGSRYRAGEHPHRQASDVLIYCSGRVSRVKGERSKGWHHGQGMRPLEGGSHWQACRWDRRGPHARRSPLAKTGTGIWCGRPVSRHQGSRRCLPSVLCVLSWVAMSVGCWCVLSPSPNQAGLYFIRVPQQPSRGSALDVSPFPDISPSWHLQFAKSFLSCHEYHSRAPSLQHNLSASLCQPSTPQRPVVSLVCSHHI